MRSLPVSAAHPSAIIRSGHPRLADFRLEEKLRRYILQHPFKTLKKLKWEVPGWKNAKVRQIQATLKNRLDFPSCCAAAKPLLTPPMVKKWLAFCKTHLHMTVEDYEDVLDESIFRLINARAQKMRRGSSTNRYLQKYTVKTMKHPASVMIWGCFSGKGGRGSPSKPP